MTTPIANVNNATLNALIPNLDVGDIADPALRSAAFQYIYTELQTIITAYNAFVAAGGVATGNLADLSVTTAKLNDLAVTTGKITDLAVTTTKMNDLAVTAAKIAMGTITSAQIADLGVATADLADSVITTIKLADASVSTAKIADIAVTLAKMAASSVGSTQLVDLSVITAKLNELSVTTAKLAESSVTISKMANSSVGTDELVAQSVTNEKVANGVLTADKFVAGALTNETENALRITQVEDDVTALSVVDAGIQAQAALITQDTIKPLFLNTYDGAQDALHPSYCYVPGGIGGRKHWLAYTPLTSADPYPDRWECPCIAHSIDGYDWKTPTGLTNPLDDLTAGEITSEAYYSDPTLLYNDVLGRLEIFYRYSLRSNTQHTMMYRKTSTDGFTWSTRVLVYDSSINPSLAPATSEIVAPQVSYKTGIYRMYYKFNPGVGDVSIRYAETTDSTNWNVATIDCVLTDYPTGRNALWHLGIHFDPTDNAYHLLSMENPTGIYGDVLYYKSTDGINFVYQGIALTHADKIGWKVKELYQTHMGRVNGEWLVYATVVIQYNYKNDGAYAARRMIALFTGADLLHLSPADGGARNTREVFLNDILLGNSTKVNQKRLRVIMMETEDKTADWGMGIDGNTLSPIWVEGSGVGITSSKYMTTNVVAAFNPNIIPQHRGQIWINNVSIYIAKGTASIADWIRIGIINTDGTVTFPGITNSEMEINTKATDIASDTSIDATGKYLMLIATVTNATISTITGGINGQHIIIANRQGTPITLTHTASGGAGKLILKGQVNRVLPAWYYETIKLMQYNGFWIEI